MVFLIEISPEEIPCLDKPRTIIELDVKELKSVVSLNVRF